MLNRQNSTRQHWKNKKKARQRFWNGLSDWARRPSVRKVLRVGSGSEPQNLWGTGQRAAISNNPTAPLSLTHPVMGIELVQRAAAQPFLLASLSSSNACHWVLPAHLGFYLSLPGSCSELNVHLTPVLYRDNALTVNDWCLLQVRTGKCYLMLSSPSEWQAAVEQRLSGKAGWDLGSLFKLLTGSVDTNRIKTTVIP